MLFSDTESVIESLELSVSRIKEPEKLVRNELGQTSGKHRIQYLMPELR
jgi:hypothetical protein